jgi:methionine-rich copper-binding protein CopC
MRAPMSTTAPRRRRRAVIAAAAVALAVVGITATATSASAHDQFVSMTPGDGTHVDALPEQVTLSFDNSVGSEGSAVVVRAPGGARVDTAKPHVVDASISVPLRPVAAVAGTYTVDYRIVSADGHPVTGHRTFVLTTGAAATAAASPVVHTTTSSADSGGGHGTHILIGVAVAVVAAAAFGVDVVRRRRQAA